jgi:transformation/transcription domain-associated protein
LFIESSPLPENFENHIKACLDVIRGDFPDVDEKLPDGRDKSLAKRKLQNELVSQLLEAVFYAVSIEETKERSMKLIKDLCEHFTILELGEFVLEKRKVVRPFELNENEGIPYIDPKIILSVVVYALSHYNEDVKEAGRQAIHYIYDACVSIFGSSNEIHRFPMFRSIFGKLSHTCFEVEYYRKAGACLGMTTLLRDLGLPIFWIAPRHIEFIRTLFFVLKDTSNDYPSSVRDNASELCYYVLRECNKDISSEQIAGKQFQQLTGFLTYGLGNANPVVRETSKRSLEILAEVSSRSLHEIIKPVSAPLLTSIFGKPLRALPFPMQIGHIDAIAFCLGLENTFLEFNDELMRLLSEDESLTSAHRAFEYKTSEQLVQLRIVCIQLLSLALTTSDYLATQQVQTRAKIIAVFFKTLYSRSSKVVEAAHLGLKRVLAQNVKLPRDLLQNGLRPILMNLSDHKRLTVPGLEGLARLLELLTFYFKVEIGKKLLDHLKAWAEPSQLHANSTKNLNSQQNIKVIAAILNVFHLLPPTAYVFMNDLMHTLFYLESHLRRQHNSPFRLPIAKFLDRYPQQAFAYFVPKLSDRTYGRFYSSILANENCANLREHTRENLEEMRKAVMELEGQEEKCVAVCNFIYIMRALNDDDEKWIVEHKAILDDINSSIGDLVQVSTSGSLTSPLCLQVEQSVQDLQDLFVKYFTAKADDQEALFSLVANLSKHGVSIHAGITDFLFSEVACSTDVSKRRAYLNSSIDHASNKANVLETRTFVVKYIINPILIVESRRNGDLSKLLDKCTGSAKGTNSWLDIVHSKIWRPSRSDSFEDHVGTMDHFRFELLQMSALLIKTSPQLVADARKDIIKFGWVYIKLEDIISKQAAYVLIAYFIAAYDTLSKIVVQIYVALLKTHQNEAKSLVKQALDLLAPVLIKRVNSPLWAKWPRRVLSEDGHNVGQVVNIYQFIVRHAELFYDYRDHFVSNIIAAMPKLTFLSNSSSENHQLAVDLAELILKWEDMFKEKESSTSLPPSGSKRKASEMEADESTGQEPSSGTPAMETIQQAYSIPFAQREACITYLIRFVCISTQKISDNPLGERVVKILDQLLSEDHWPEVVVKLTFFERSLVHNDISSSPNGLAICLNALEVISVTLQRKKASWIVGNLHHLERLLEKCIRSDNLGEWQYGDFKLIRFFF